jgi:SAM-dependent methyltransferase
MDELTPSGSPDDAYRIRWEEFAPRLAVAADVDADWYASVAAQLVSPVDRLAVDIGCGAAGMAVALAGALPAGRVLAVDSDPAVLDAARAHLPSTGPVPVELVMADLDGDLSGVSAALGAPADLVWASASVHHAGDQQRAIDALAGLLGPGGRLALAEGGLPTRCLPWDLGVGPPGLEQRLDDAQGRWFAQMRGRLPGTVRMPYGWTEALRRAGLTAVSTRSWLLEAPTPLSTSDRAHVVGELAFRVDRLRPVELLAPDDLVAWDRLLDEDDPDWLGARDDLYRLTARSVHTGVRVPT